MKDCRGYQKRPPVRLHNRCKLTGRPKGYKCQFGLSRVKVSAESATKV
jgi:ribosomal protein S14